MIEALFYEKTGGERVKCGLCRFRCTIPPGGCGICKVRENRDGALSSLVYGKVIAENVDPVEKKPLFHFLPGSRTFSIATAGCNFHCLQCQNWSISQLDGSAKIPGVLRSPEDIVQRAVDSGCSSIAYTYTEPTIFYEYALATATIAKAAGLKNIFVTNGYICAEPLRRIAPFLHAANIDLKGFDEKKYPQIFGGELAEVLDSIVIHKELGIWLELTTLLIPGVNDSRDEISGIAAFIRNRLGSGTPWHLSRFHPTYRMTDRPPTAVETVRTAAAIGREAGLHFVYEGNMPAGNGEDTFCPECAKAVIRRNGFSVTANSLLNGCCPDCGAAVAGVMR